MSKLDEYEENLRIEELKAKWWAGWIYGVLTGWSACAIFSFIVLSLAYWGE